MNINVGNVIVLDNDNEYVVAAKSNFNGKDYLYIINSDLKEVMFCYIDNDEIVRVDDSDELNDVMNELAKEGCKYLKELELNEK